MNSPDIAMMMAMDKNQLIGSSNGMPWHIPGEQAYFKATTLGKPVIMGRKTFESIGKPLPGRPNIVVTRNAKWQFEGAHVVSNLQQSLELGATLAAACEPAAQEIVVIGGAALCRDAMPLTHRLYLTTIDHAFEGDTWLDSFSWDHWQVISSEQRDPHTTDGLAVTYWVLERAGL